MKHSGALIVSIATLAAAYPAASVDYTPKGGGWGAVDYSKVDYNKVDYDHIDYSKVDYSKVDYDHIDYSKVDYSHIDWSKVNYSKVDYSHVDWSKVDYGKVDWSKVDFGKVDYGKVDWSKVHYPATPQALHFTSSLEIRATPDQVVNGTTPTGGLSGASGLYKLALNSHENMICYNITLYGFKGDYTSPALTATHIHEAARGQSGPPRVAFPNPVDIGNGIRRSVGCVSGPFRTGVLAPNGQDSGTGFDVARIEANPSAFFADVHSTLAVPGAVRGQLA